MYFVTHFQVIYIHYKLRIVRAIRGMQWMKITMVNSAEKHLKSVSSDGALMHLEDLMFEPS